MPTLRIIETPQRNAFASGIREKQYSITVTRGLMDALDDAELEAVLAHELTHIRNRDVQLLVICAVFVGIITLVGELIVRSPRALLERRRPGSSRGSGRGKGGGGDADPHPGRDRHLPHRPLPRHRAPLRPVAEARVSSPTPARSS